VTRPLIVRLASGAALPGDEPLVVDRAATAPAPPDDRRAPGGAGERTGHGPEASAIAGPIRRSSSGTTLMEVVVDGWRFELEIEDAARAELRRRATRTPDAVAASGPLEIRAIIPGRVAAVRVAAGDPVEAGGGLLVIEAMKMQNELRAPRAGKVERVAVGERSTIEVGDLLVVIE
jgi:biotin carboxyl carrier protein